MSFELLLAFNIALLAAIASPGPALLMAIRTSVVKGRASGARLGIGLAFMASMWTLMALLGLEGIFAAFPWAYVAVKTAGALYLLYIAWKTWTGATARIENHTRPANRDFVDGILLNLANPKSVLFAAAVLIVIFPPDLPPAAMAVIVANHFLVEVICYSLIAITLSTPAFARRYLSARKWLDRFASIVLAGLGLRLLLQR